MSNPTRLKRAGIVNIFLVEDGEGITVVDTALPKSTKHVVRAAGVIGKPITRIVLTHAHDDHVGSLDELHAALPDAKIYMTARDARLLAGDKSLDADEPQDKLRGGLKGQKTVPDVLVEDGDSIGSLKVIFTPGHTPGHMALHDSRDNTIYCADVFSTLGGLATTARTNPLFPLPAMATWHPPTVLKSARLLADMDPARLAPGHGRVIDNPTQDMYLVIEKAEKHVFKDKQHAGRHAKSRDDQIMEEEEELQESGHNKEWARKTLGVDETDAEKD
jgi:glyoxylase-like metal-dependent hydrolase (beta-lactamase superfamily II)